MGTQEGLGPGGPLDQWTGTTRPAAALAHQIVAFMQVGTKNRSTGATLMNQDSSRSHSIFTIIVEMVAKPGSGSSADSTGGSAATPGASPHRPASGSPSKPQGSKIRVGKLYLVDLAGSERQSKTQASGERLREASKINLSLSALGNVIAALTADAAGVNGASTSSTSAQQQHIPYRDSKLTRLLSDSLGGNSKTVMVANICPADSSWEETLSTLRYASRAKFIKNQPKINEDPKVRPGGWAIALHRGRSGGQRLAKASRPRCHGHGWRHPTCLGPQAPSPQPLHGTCLVWCSLLAGHHAA